MTNYWQLLQDLVGAADNWPTLIRRKFWCSSLSYADRAFFASFGYCNGVSSYVIVNTLKQTNPNCTPVKLQKIEALYDYSDDPVYGFERRNNYFSYNLILERVVTLNGQVYHSRSSLSPYPFVHTTQNIRDSAGIDQFSGKVILDITSTEILFEEYNQ